MIKLNLQDTSMPILFNISTQTCHARKRTFFAHGAYSIFFLAFFFFNSSAVFTSSSMNFFSLIYIFRHSEENFASHQM